MRFAPCMAHVFLVSLFACSGEDLIMPTQDVFEVSLGEFPTTWLADYQDGQTYVFVNGNGTEADWNVQHSGEYWQSCASSLDGDTIFLCERTFLELSNTTFVANVQMLGQDSTFFLDPEGRQNNQDFVSDYSVFAYPGDGDYEVRYGGGNANTPTYEWTYQTGPAYPAMGSDSLRLLARNAAMTQFQELLFVQGRGWIFYRDSLGEAWTLDRVEN